MLLSLLLLRLLARARADHPEVALPDLDIMAPRGYNYRLLRSACSDGCGEGLNTARLECYRLERGSEVLESPEACAKLFNKPAEVEERCYGTAPTANFCVSCPLAMGGRCRECVPGFLLDETGICRNPLEQVTFTMTAKENITSKWLAMWRPRLDKCAKTLVKGSTGNYVVKAYAVVPGPRHEGAEIRVAVAGSQGQTAASIGELLQRNYGRSSDFAMKRNACPKLLLEEFVVQVVPVDPQAAVVLPGGRKAMSLRAYLGLASSMLLGGGMVLGVFEPRHRRREITFLTDVLHSSSFGSSVPARSIDIELSRK